MTRTETIPSAAVPNLYHRDLAAVAAAQRLRPLAVEAGNGCWQREEGGRRLLDLSASWCTAGVGYAHPAVVAAVARAVGSMPGAGVLSATNPEVVGLAEELLATMPATPHHPALVGHRRVYVGLTGSDANTAVIRAARAATGRHRVLAFGGAYHGGLGEAQRVSGLYVAAGVPAEPGLVLHPFPNPYRPHLADASPAALASDVLTGVEASLAEGDVALVLVEPVLSDGGVVVPPAGFLAGLCAACDRHGTLLAADEVKVGLGRTGHLHAFTADGVVPHVVVLGKSLGGGLPLSAAIGPAAMFDAAEGAALLTLAGNPVSAAAGRAVLSTVQAENLPQRAADLGSRLNSALLGLVPAHPLIGDVRGRGLSIGVELVSDPATRAPAPVDAAKVAYRAWQLGAVVYIVGQHHNVLEITPPLTLTESDADLAVNLLDQALTDVAAGRVSDASIQPYRGW